MKHLLFVCLICTSFYASADVSRSFWLYISNPSLIVDVEELDSLRIPLFEDENITTLFEDYHTAFSYK